MKAKCKKCGGTVEVTKPREFKSCKCGAISLDYGDGYYFRVGGCPEDFDGEIEDAPKIKDLIEPVEKTDKSTKNIDKVLIILSVMAFVIAALVIGYMSGTLAQMYTISLFGFGLAFITTIIIIIFTM